jgi:Mg2+ and Co2+ transporter CorA
MPKSNSESDFGGSITSDGSDVDEGPSSGVAANHLATSPRANLKMDHYNNSSLSVLPTKARAGSPSGSVATRATRISAIDVAVDGEATVPKLRGIALFRATARKIMKLRQLSSMMGGERRAGAEPGIDPRRASAIAAYGHIRETCDIQVVDYSSLRSKFHKFDNKGFVDFLQETGATKEPWSRARWISIGGISWDVISSLALTYGRRYFSIGRGWCLQYQLPSDLHPLSLEDILHRRGYMRSKADYFSRHLFLRVLCHSVDSAGQTDPEINITTLPRSLSPTGLRPNSQFSDDKSSGYETGDVLYIPNSQTQFFRRRSTGKTRSRNSTVPDLEVGGLQVVIPRKRESNAEAMATLDQLKAGGRVNVSLKNLFLFLLRDGTVISIHQTPSSKFSEPILTRLRTSDSVLRSTADPSLLLESILDLVVDHAVEVVQEYEKAILKLECEILLKPNMTSVKHRM